MKQWIIIRTALVLLVSVSFPATGVFASDKAKIVSFLNNHCLATGSEDKLRFTDCNSTSVIVFSVIPLSSGEFHFETKDQNCLYVEEAISNRQSSVGLAACADGENQIFALKPLDDFKYSLTAWSGRTCLISNEDDQVYGAACNDNDQQAFRIRPAN